MNDPDKYFSVKHSVGQLTSVYLPKVLDAMSWGFKRGNILDYGSGPGNVGHRFLLPKAEETDSKLHFVDISPEMVEYSGKNFPHPRISHRVGSLPGDFPLAPGFDRVLTVNVVQLMRDVGPLLGAIEKILKPGGQYGLISPTIGNVVFRTREHLINSPVWKPYMEGLAEFQPEWSRVPEGEDAAEFLKNVFVTATGLNVAYFLYETPTLEFEMDQYLDFALSINPLVRLVPAELLGQLREEYRSFITTDLQVPLDSEVVTFPHEYVSMVLQK